VRAQADAAAAEGVRALSAAIGTGSGALAGAVVVGPPAGPPRALAEIVRSHTALHTAEGELYRSVVRDACAALGVEAEAVPRKGLVERVADVVGVDLGSVRATVDGLGRTLGPPWRKEQKEAALAAWWGLAHRSLASR
jgi:hypothetical protein